MDALTLEGADQVAQHLAGVATTAQTAVDAALTKHGQTVATEARNIAPKRTGATANAITTTYTPSTGLVVDAGGAAAPAAYVFHAQALGKSGGYMVFRVPRHTRRGYTVNGYNALRRIRNDPYLFTTWDRNIRALQEAVETAVAKGVTDG